MTKTPTFWVSFSACETDADNGIIKNASVITIGPALGHDLEIDRTSLEEVCAAISKFKNGAKVKADHGGGVFSIVGSLRNPHIEGDKVKGDIHLLKSLGEKRAHLIELADELSDTFGLSVSIHGKHQKIGGKTYARCERIRSCDIVTDPAANPDGLLDEGEVDTELNGMTIEDLLQQFSEFKGATETRIASLETLLSDTSKTLKALSETDTVSKADLKEATDALDVRLTALNETVEKIPTGGKAAAGGEGGTGNEEGPKNFDEAVATFTKEGKAKTEAIKLAIGKYGDLYKADLVAKGIVKL